MFVDLITDWRCSLQWWSATSEYWWPPDQQRIHRHHHWDLIWDGGNEIWLVEGQIYLLTWTNKFGNLDKYKSMASGHQDSGNFWAGFTSRSSLISLMIEKVFFVEKNSLAVFIGLTHTRNILEPRILVEFSLLACIFVMLPSSTKNINLREV